MYILNEFEKYPPDSMTFKIPSNSQHYVYQVIKIKSLLCKETFVPKFFSYHFQINMKTCKSYNVANWYLFKKGRECGILYYHAHIWWHYQNTSTFVGPVIWHQHCHNPPMLIVSCHEHLRNTKPEKMAKGIWLIATDSRYSHCEGVI